MSMPTLKVPLYAYVWRTTRTMQIRICIITAILSPLSMLPLELQRRIINDATERHNIRLLVLYGLAYVATALVQGGLKYGLNMQRGVVLETVARDLRRRILQRVSPPGLQSGRMVAGINAGKVVSMLAAESEDVAGFAADAISLPLLQFGTITFVLGYLLWLQPAIAVLAFVIYFPQAVIVPMTQRTINRMARMRMRLVRYLGHLAVRRTPRDAYDPARPPGSVLIDRIFRIRIWIYLRKFFLTALGNFLDSLGPIVVLVVGGWLVIHGRTEVSTLVVFISGFQRLSDPWDQIVSFYRSVTNTDVIYRLIRDTIE